MTFSFPSPVFLVGEGELPRAQFEQFYQPQMPLIAADGGANHLQAFGVWPDAVIGDMDSLQNRPAFEKNSKVLQLHDQDSTDLEKCLDEVEAPLILAFGFTGKRFDHTLEILHVLQKYTHKQLAFFSREDLILRLPQHAIFSLPLGTRVSLYPLKTSSPLRSKGLKYPLDTLQLEQGRLIGTSNEVTEPQVEIEQVGESLMGIFPIEHSQVILETFFKSF